MKNKLSQLWLNDVDYPILLKALRYDIEENGMTSAKQKCLDKLTHFIQSK